MNLQVSLHSFWLFSLFWCLRSRSQDPKRQHHSGELEEGQEAVHRHKAMLGCQGRERLNGQIANARDCEYKASVWQFVWES